MPKVQPEILKWARETAGFSPEEAAKKLAIKPARGVAAVERLAALEAGSVEPTRPMLVKMAKQYHRPLLVFYLSAPPKKGKRGKDFRTLPDAHPLEDARLDALIRDVQARQSRVRAMLEDEEETEPLDFIASMEMADGGPAILDSIRQTLNFDLAEYRAHPNQDRAFAFLRAKTEAVGIFVLLIGDLGSYHTAISPGTFRGFALADPIAPFIVINDRDSRAAWCFTLVHELVHLWLGQTGVSGGSRAAERGIEKFCNELASELLLPATELVSLAVDPRVSTNVLRTRVATFARERKISSSMVAYRLHRLDLISERRWEDLRDYFHGQWLSSKREQQEKNRSTEGGPNYYAVRRQRLGNALLEFVRRMLTGGDLSTTQASQVLGVKATGVHSLLDL